MKNGAWDQLNISSTASSGDLLANTNRLLATVGISSKTILSLEELTRVASSMFVAIFESLFKMKIDDIIRNPVTKEDYEHNAQLVVDYLSEKIQMDLKHLTGRSIVAGDVKALSNLVHILVRIASVTSQDTLSSIESEFTSDEDGKHHRSGRIHSPNSMSLSTQSYEGKQTPIRPKSARRYETKQSTFDSTAFYNNFLHSSLTRAESYIEQEQKLALAQRRRENAAFAKESQSKIQNMRHAEISKRALQSRWKEDQVREHKSFALRKSNEENVMLRKIYQNLLWKVMQWRIEEDSESKERSRVIKEHARWHAEALHTLFEDRLALLKEQDARLMKIKERALKEENNRTRELLNSIAKRQGSLIGSIKNNHEQKKEKELLRRKETHDNLLSLLSVEGTFMRQHNLPSQRRSSSAPRPSRRYPM